MTKKMLLVFSVCLLVLTLSFTWKRPKPSAAFSADFAEINTPLEVSTSGYPFGTTLSYQWYIDDVLVESSKHYYTPTQDDLEHFITVIVTPSDGSDPLTLSTYFSKLPVFYLTTQETIEHGVYSSGTLTVQGNHLYPTSEILYSGGIQIRGRGNSTWDAYPKKPYKIKLDQKADLFGMGSNKHWVLLANYADESLIRNKIAYDLSGALGMTYMESTWVDVILNGEYVGNYLLCEHVRIDEERVDITDLTAYTKTVADVLVKAEVFPKQSKQQLEDALELDLGWLSTGVFTFMDVEYDIRPYLELPELTGGFLMEIDAYFDEPSKFFAQTQPVMFKNPEYACTNDAIMEYAGEYFTAAFEAMLESEDFYASFQGTDVSYTELFDVYSLAQYVLVQEIFFNYDALLKSMYLYKDLNSLAHMGPIWDMDWSSGRTHSSYSVEQWWTVYYTENEPETLWYSGLIRDPYFLSVMKEVWDSSYDDIMALITNDGTIQQAYEYIYESGLANTAAWPFEYGFTNSYNTFLAWMKDRLAWLEPQFIDLETLVESVGYCTTDSSIQIACSDTGIQAISPRGSFATLYYNDIRISQQSLTDGCAFWDAELYKMTHESDVIQIRIYDENNTLLGTNYMDLRP